MFMLAGFFFYSTSDMLAKVLSETVNPLQIAWLRQLGLLSGVVVLLAWKGPRILRSRHPFLQFGRGLTVVVAATSFLFAITYVPLADATAVSFIAPFIVIVLAGLVLGETVGLKRWIAVALGFAGTMIIIRPGFNAFHPAIFLVILSGLAFGIRQIISRRVSGTDPLVTTIAYTALTAALLLSLPLPFIWKNPLDLTQFLMMVGIAIIAGCGELSIMRALDLGEAVVLSPLQYTLMIWATIWGFLIFAQLPDMWTLIGTAIVIGSGIYSLYHETRAPR
ncbi:DMT family transporter [Mesorhizobium australicum]|uniref:S-adenosylmethionine uptake transporter n=1 Tax=Mesorhizobium australicum TaxID=536018 RepID=A0A1X7PRL3_9HYPH|nr:DMT family transporter [Mesorhizobium australicum]SMH54625.1 S-adenosylmethionine uptake transporter [Mesorhizobium australicum]